MRFLIDENIPTSIADWLIALGHDISRAALVEAGAPDTRWLSAALAEGRIVLTSDKDFGELVYRDKLTAPGIILLRLDSLPVFEWLDRLKETWGVIEANPSARFIVVKPTRIRVRLL